MKDTVNSSFHRLSPTSVSPPLKKSKIAKPTTPILTAHFSLVSTAAFEELPAPIIMPVLDFHVEELMTTAISNVDELPITIMMAPIVAINSIAATFEKPPPLDQKRGDF